MTKPILKNFIKIYKKIKKNHKKRSCRDHFSSTSSENSDVESFCPQNGHFPLVGLKTSLIDFSIFISLIFSPHFPHVISTDIEITRILK